MRCFLLFVDGLGLAPAPDPDHNPLLRARLPNFHHLTGGRPLVQTSLPFPGPALVVPTDAALGVPGLPQSATGQTAILTGVNAPAHIGRHLNGYPSPRLRALLAEHSLLKQATGRGFRATFLNAYAPIFFDWIEAGMPDQMPGLGPLVTQKRQRWRPSASTLANMAAGLPFRGFPELLAGQAVYHDITRFTVRERGYDQVPEISPAEAGRHAAAAMAEHDLVFFEPFLTDVAGHSQEMEWAVGVLELLDGFLGGLLAHLEPDVLLLIVSDHGNIEDLSVKTHTDNPVPTILYCPGDPAAAGRAAARISSLLDITPTLLAALAGEL
jgi:2,3-bisphosphoglycerate-independent phosphoglycerate mutase